jgi:hypothetical protein
MDVAARRISDRKPVRAALPHGCATMALVKEEPPHHTIKRRSDEPKLQIGERVLVKEGVIGVVLARYTPSGTPNEVRYIVEVLPGESEKGRA